METSLLSCPVCLKPHFESVDALRSSLINVATTHISCPVCNELLFGLDKLTIHLFSHISSNEIAQINVIDETEPEKTFLQDNYTNATEELEINKNKAIQEEKSNLNCDICNFHFSDETILDLHHKLLHQTSPDRKTGKYNFHCHLCRKQFRLRGSLMVHFRVAHFGFVQNNLKKNSENSQNIEETQNYQNMLQVDKRKVLNVNLKSQDKQWECDVCLKSFTTKYFLKKHKRLHTGEMPYYCSQCNKYFTFQQSYHKHMLYHSDDKPHICTECGRAFKELSTLHNHERIHSGERPFSCETCGKCFRQRVSYLVHRRIHTGVMPYKCTACNKSFRYKVSQRSHKCPVDPPGYVIKTPDLVEKLIHNKRVNDCNEAQTYNIDNPLVDTKSNLEDVNNYELLENDLNLSLENRINNYIEVNDNQEFGNNNENTLTESNHSNPDFFALILSPVLSDVQSLCLSNHEEKGNTSTPEALQTINEESFKELLYGPK